MEHECIIGQWWDYENTRLVTASEVVEAYESEIKYDALPDPLSNYFDKRYETELERFDYCPVCGKKINWAMLRERAKTHEKHA